MSERQKPRKVRGVRVSSYALLDDDNGVVFSDSKLGVVTYLSAALRYGVRALYSVAGWISQVIEDMQL